MEVVNIWWIVFFIFNRRFVMKLFFLLFVLVLFVVVLFVFVDELVLVDFLLFNFGVVSEYCYCGIF